MFNSLIINHNKILLSQIFIYIFPLNNSHWQCIYLWIYLSFDTDVLLYKFCEHIYAKSYNEHDLEDNFICRQLRECKVIFRKKLCAMFFKEIKYWTKVCKKWFLIQYIHKLIYLTHTYPFRFGMICMNENWWWFNQTLNDWTKYMFFFDIRKICRNMSVNLSHLRLLNKYGNWSDQMDEEWQLNSDIIISTKV